ncbi:MAG: TraR/DksA family transcriptional regulator [Anaerolineae bacterium]|nr:TraR/DksA family transcriptional regulator [Anaerolineae bacterium]
MVTTKEQLHSVLQELHTTYEIKVELWEKADTLDAGGTGYTNHQADDATAVYDQTVNASTIKAVRTRLRQIKEALARVEAGTYGVCDNCGREIDIARLEAIPYTWLCLRCAETRDYQAGM